ncbi:MAG TPA: hypothetical protein VGM51_11415 [Armatimonadota bacterium]
MQRWVGAIRITGLYTHVEAERGTPSPLAVANGKTIMDACPAARSRGVAPGMPVPTARRFCGGLRVIPYDPRRYRSISNAWMRLGLEHAPWLEPLDPHEAFLDLAGHPDPEGAIAEIHAGVFAMGFSVRAGLATNKLVARAATIVPDTLRDNVTLVPAGAEAAFLAPHPVRALWPLNEKVIQRLERLEYENVAELAASDVADLKAQVGREASLVHTLARGVYPDPVRPLYPEANIRRRKRWLEGLEREEDLATAVTEMAEDAAVQLGGRCCRVMCVILELEDHTRLEERETRRLLDRSCLPAVAKRLVARMAPEHPVTGMAFIGADIVDPPPLEGDLFTLDKIRRKRTLETSMECLEERYGKRILFPCSDVPIPWRQRAWEAFWSRHRGIAN